MIKVIKNFNKGFSLVELLVSITVFLIFVIAVANTMGSVSKGTRNSANRERANILAEEALEATRNIRDADFANLTNGVHGLSTSGSQWNLSGSSDVTDIFTRVVNVSTVSDNQKKVDVTVSWADTTSPTNSVTSSTYLTNWHAILNLGVGLTVNKSVINHGGSKIAGDFAPYQVDTTTVVLGVANLFDIGTHTVSETTSADYTQTFSGDCNSSGVVNLVANTPSTCLITNEEKASRLTVTKTVINHGQTKVAGDFVLLVDSNPVVSGVTNTFNSGAHTVSETPNSDYVGTFSGDCNSSGSVTLFPNITKNCTLTNEEKLSSIIVNKAVTNHGGSKVAGDFAPYKVGGTTVTLGAITTLNSGTYTVSETTSSNYAQTFSGDCNSSGSVTLTSGTIKTCTITNEEQVTPTVTTPTVTSIGTTTATLGANVTSLGIPASITARGTCWGTTPAPTTNCVAEGGTTTGVFTQARTGFTAGTLYYYRGYATNSTGTVYSPDGSFTTVTIPTLTNSDISSITQTTAVGGGTISSNGGATVTVSGLVWDIAGNPTVALSTKTTDGWAIGGPWTSSMTGLTPGTFYYVRAYATNSAGTAYGAGNKTFTALAVPGLINPTSSTITQTTATLGVNVNYSGFPSTLSDRGICYGTTPAPTTNCTSQGGTSTGVLTQPITGLTAGIFYYYRGYATNSTGTGYSSDGTFTTLSLPIVTTPTVTSIGTTTATLGANVTSLGIPASITARGTCWGTTPAPTTNCVAEGGTTTGVFTQARTGFTAGTLYYYRGYATNSTGTVYSPDGSFTTISACSVASTLIGTPTLYNSAASTSASVAMPTGVVKDDIMFAYIMHYNATDRLTTIPAGWLPFDGATGRHKNGNYNQALYYKVALAGEAGPYVFGLTVSSKLAVTISAYRGCFDPTNPIDSSSNVEYVSPSNTTYRAGSVTLSTTNITVLMFPSMYTTSVKTFANPTTQSGGWTEDYDQGATTSSFSRALYRKFIAVSGGTGVIDSIGTAGTTVKHAFAVALHPL